MSILDSEFCHAFLAYAFASVHSSSANVVELALSSPLFDFDKLPPAAEAGYEIPAVVETPLEVPPSEEKEASESQTNAFAPHNSSTICHRIRRMNCIAEQHRVGVCADGGTHERERGGRSGSSPKRAQSPKRRLMSK
jgi:hypothetical protein